MEGRGEGKKGAGKRAMVEGRYSKERKRGIRERTRRYKNEGERAEGERRYVKERKRGRRKKTRK